MDSNIEVEHEEELDFQLEINEDVSSEDDNMPSDRNPPLEEDGNGSSEKEKFRSMSHAALRHTTLDEHLEIVRKTFATEGDAYIFYNKYARDKGFSVRKQKVKRAKHSGALLFRRFLCSRESQRLPKWLNKKPCKHRLRALTRCGCLARLEIKLDRSRGLWYVHRFVDRHDHRLAMQDEAPTQEIEGFSEN